MIYINGLAFSTANKAAKHFELNRVYLYQVIRKYGKNLNYFPNRPNHMRRWEVNFEASEFKDVST